MTKHESRRTQAKIKAIMESGHQSHYMGSRLAAPLATPDGHTRQLAVADSGPVQSEPWLAAWTPKFVAT